MSFAFYKVLHLFGLFLLFLGLGGIALHAWSGGARESGAARRAAYATHGIGALLALTGGFGLLARMNIVQAHAFPGWVVAKMLVWLVLALAIALPYRGRRWAAWTWLAAPLLGLAAAYFARYKPF